MTMSTPRGRFGFPFFLSSRPLNRCTVFVFLGLCCGFLGVCIGVAVRVRNVDILCVPRCAGVHFHCLPVTIDGLPVTKPRTSQTQTASQTDLSERLWHFPRCELSRCCSSWRRTPQPARPRLCFSSRTIRVQWPHRGVPRPGVTCAVCADLLLGGMHPLNFTRRLLDDGGAKFTNFFVHTPVCCPSRRCGCGGAADVT